MLFVSGHNLSDYKRVWLRLLVAALLPNRVSSAMRVMEKFKEYLKQAKTSGESSGIALS